MDNIFHGVYCDKKRCIENIVLCVYLMHLCSLISAFVIRVLENIITQHATSDIVIFSLVPVAKYCGVCMTINPVRKPQREVYSHLGPSSTWVSLCSVAYSMGM